MSIKGPAFSLVSLHAHRFNIQKQMLVTEWTDWCCLRANRQSAWSQTWSAGQLVHIFTTGITPDWTAGVHLSTTAALWSCCGSEYAFSFQLEDEELDQSVSKCDSDCSVHMSNAGLTEQCRGDGDSEGENGWWSSCGGDEGGVEAALSESQCSSTPPIISRNGELGEWMAV